MRNFLSNLDIQVPFIRLGKSILFRLVIKWSWFQVCVCVCVCVICNIWQIWGLNTIWRYIICYNWSHWSHLVATFEKPFTRVVYRCLYRNLLSNTHVSSGTRQNQTCFRVGWDLYIVEYVDQNMVKIFLLISGFDTCGCCVNKQIPQQRDRLFGDLQFLRQHTSTILLLDWILCKESCNGHLFWHLILHTKF